MKLLIAMLSAAVLPMLPAAAAGMSDGQTITKEALEKRFYDPSSFREICSPTRRETELEIPAGATTFTILMKVNFSAMPHQMNIFEIPGVTRLTTRYFGVYAYTRSNDNMQNYLNWPGPQRFRRILEAELKLNAVPRPRRWFPDIYVGIPWSLLPQDEQEHEVVLDYNGIFFTMLVDGVKVDEYLPIGLPEKFKSGVKARIHAPQAIRSVRLSVPSASYRTETTKMTFPAPLHLFTPDGFNTWVGDVSTFFHDGRLHLFYLFDRRHHGSKYRGGGHNWAHLSSTDLRHWTEHEDALKLDHQCETMGTGNVFFYKGKYYFSYGHHTQRYYPKEKTVIAAIETYMRQKGESPVLNQKEVPDLLPDGASYAVSDDGIHFTKSRNFIHAACNPSIYPNPDGTLTLFAGFDGAQGIWKAKEFPGAFTCVNRNFPTSGKNSYMDNSLECPCRFSWNGSWYLLIGGTALWMADNIDFNNPRDLSREGDDIYDGNYYPMVSEFTGNRRILAGWIMAQENRWGGFLTLRELIQFPDRKLGIKWLDEAMPPAHASYPLANKYSKGTEYLLPSDSGYLTFQVRPEGQNGAVAVRFPADDGRIVEFHLDIAGRRAQYGIAPSMTKRAPVILTSKEWCDLRAQKSANLPPRVLHQAVGNLRNLEKPFQVRMLIKHSPRAGGTVFDVEIAGCRTLIKSFESIRVGSVGVYPEGSPAPAVTELRFAPLKEVSLPSFPLLSKGN